MGFEYDEKDAASTYVLARLGVEWLHDDAKKLAAIHARILMDATSEDSSQWDAASYVYYAVREDAGNPFGFDEVLKEYAEHMRMEGYVELR